MTDFLLELRSEEIPARMQAGARESLAKLFTAELAKAGLSAGEIVTYAGPRRLALIAKGLPAATEAVSEEVKGPRASAPPQALEGFLRKTGLTREQLTERDGVLFAITEKPGRATAEVLAEAIPAIVRAFPWPKSMRWGAESASTESMRWVRPLHAIVALFGGEVVPFEVAGITSGNVTRGHRFHAPAEITLTGADTYVEQLRAAKVLVDQDERAAIIRERASALAAEAGLELVEDEGLVAENAGLTEWPVPLLGRFDEAYLDVPPEVIQLTARVNQKYFVCRSADGKLANAFVCTANIEATDGGTKIVEGNGKVLAARLSDARFFYETDLKTKLDDLRPKLEKIVFHEKLGTVAGKVERVAKLAEWLASEGIVPNCDSVLARRAAELAKADLVTGMVGEFPELQGLMGGYYAAAQGEDTAVAEAVRDHYKPVGQGDDVPSAPVTVAVALADKLDTIVSFFSIDEKPTGSKDPFALRRAALGVIALVLSNGLRGSLYSLFHQSAPEAGDGDMGQVVAADYFYDFVIDRLKVQQRSEGVRHDVIDAVVRMGGDDDIGGERDLVRLLARVRALQAFVTTDDGTNLLAGYKRAANILKKEGVEGDQNWTAPTYTLEPAEADLIAALDAAEPKAAQAVKAEDFEAAMAALASLRAPIDRFFDDVTVNDADAVKRTARLALLARVRAAVHTVADFSRIEG
ncbi:glycyl-tRNA synthetase, beta subunit [Sphingomonas sp. S17]|uniref:Glycine--tRNA ligase beta subunit n=3 Tax=Pseudomonadota TaxID=1224 RepID=A0A411LI87_SPHPI|nr:MULTISPECIES: glycine--tRNA ligase subunit beta [Sphingomonas]EGI53682.1 glycyl-tRNA synthetase, beta subunit [Sphingomonas sp. S17]MBQ1479581.1 glycine--tRNA ligase subunit beta [Sphingomonas sp.]MCM3678151.1 glycine--tRNA ligase subunit beta [Sphingomonas paucimobilis]MDG5972787.1 glycine--tRNA ligase subunit beta [Sphingomonas paucimobilis]NNG59318.1 glycine--tRNA ligase subunit beta [Sphingomonas paucimobilis]